jgi:Ran GTPase-activating protein (RanGAP) involved in mRNA processing and transport
MDNNILTGRSSLMLQAMLWTNNSLVKLSMQCCRLEDDGVCAILDGMMKNNKVTHINLSGNHCTDVSGMKVA